MYIDKTYYDDTYQGIPIEDTEEFNQAAKRASEIIDQLTGYKIKDIEELLTFQKEQVKKSVCAQIEHFTIGGGYQSIKEESDFNSINLGSFSVSKSQKKTSKVASEVIDFLKPTGLLYTGVVTYG